MGGAELGPDYMRHSRNVWRAEAERLRADATAVVFAFDVYMAAEFDDSKEPWDRVKAAMATLRTALGAKAGIGAAAHE